MATAPHDKTGKKCRRCGHLFTKENMTMTITTRRGNIHVAELVCAKCHHKHYERGE